MLRYAQESELQRLRRIKRRMQLFCALLVPVEIAGVAYLFHFLFTR